MLKKMFIEIRLCNPITYIFKGDVKIVKIYMVKFNVSVINAKYIHEHETVTKLINILTKCYFSVSEPYKLP